MACKYFYNTILSQVFSPCGNYLVVGDRFGQITVVDLVKVINPDTSAATNKKHFVKNSFIIANNVQINSLLTTKNFLVIGTVGELLGYTWKSIKSIDAKPAWKIDLPDTKDSFDKADVNTLLYKNENDYIFAGCGDSNIYAFDIQDGKLVQTLKGHTDYIHCIYNFGNKLVSGGEDGLVNIWDLRNKCVANKLEPHKNIQLSRPEIGNWIGALAVNDDWLVCGGGPRLSLWHLRTLNTSSIFPIDDKGIHVTDFFDDKVLAGGKSKFFYQINYNGDVITEIPSSSITLYSAVYQQAPFTALCLAGSSPMIDICSNFNYKDQVITINC